MATNKKAGSKNDNALGVAVGLSAVAAAVGAYFMYGSKKAAKNRKAVKSWMFKAKAEVLEALEGAEDMTKKEYEKLIDSIGSTYSSLASTSKAKLAAFKKKMKEHWLDIAKATIAGKKAAVKKTVKKAAATAKKTAKKATAKAEAETKA